MFRNFRNSSSGDISSKQIFADRIIAILLILTGLLKGDELMVRSSQISRSVWPGGDILWTMVISFFSWIGPVAMLYHFNWALYLRVQLTTSLHWFGSWLSHYVNQWRPSHTCHPISVCLNNQHTVGFHIKHITHGDVIKWKHFPRYWPFVRGIHRSPVNSPHKGQWRGALMFTLICARINGWVNNGEAGDLRRNRAHYDVIVVFSLFYCIKQIYLVICLGQCTCVFGDFSLSKILEIECE